LRAEDPSFLSEYGLDMTDISSLERIAENVGGIGNLQQIIINTLSN